ncbi:MAG: SpoIIE family protein phosphatase [Spirochaeta sp.]
MVSSRPSIQLLFYTLLASFTAGVIFFVQSQWQKPDPNSPMGSAGILDARGWNPREDGVLNLNGEWEFYWNEFVIPDHHPGNTQPGDERPTEIIPQPGLWNHLDIPGVYFSPKGYATLRLRLLVDDEWPETLGFYIMEVSNSLRMYVNGTLVAQAGEPGRTVDHTKHEYRPRIAEFHREGAEELDIVLHIANYIDREGGRKRPLYVGTTHDARLLQHKNIAYEGMIGGALLIIGLYNFVLFLVRREERLPLAFAFVCIVFAADVLFGGERTILMLLDIPFTTFGKIWFLQYYFMPVSMTLFIHYLFPGDSRPYFWRGLCAFALLYSLLTWLLPFSEVIDLLPVYHIASLSSLVYMTYIMVTALRHKREHSIPFTIAGILTIGTAVNDLLYAENIIVSVYLSSVGILGFAAAISGMISQRFSQTFAHEEEMAVNLRRYSNNLEELVAERTSAIEAKNRELEDGIAYAKLIQSSVLPTASEIDAIAPDSFIIFHPRDIVGGDFYWASSTGSSSGWIAVGDCTGHGVPGALMVMLSISMLGRGVASMANRPDPSNVLSELHHGVRTSMPRSKTHDGLDIGLIHYNNGKVLFAGAHMGLYVLRNTGVEYIPGSRKGAGYARTPLNYEFTSTAVQLNPGDSLYLLSDGFLDQHGGERDFPFGKRRFRHLLNSLAEVPFSRHRDALLQALNEYRRDRPQRDDIVVAGIQHL